MLSPVGRERQAIIATGSHAPYTPFLSKNNAVLAWSLTFHPKSGPTEQFPRGSEFGSWIFKNPDGFYMFGSYWPTRGATYTSPPMFATRTYTRVGSIHTHPKPRGSEVFSGWINIPTVVPGRYTGYGDGHFAYERGWPVFLVTPQGYVRRLCPKWAESAQIPSSFISNNSPHVTTLFNILR